MRRIALQTVLGVVAAGALAAPAYAGDHGRLHTVATGLDNPRGIVALSGDRLVVAEAGHAGDVCLGPGECLGLTGRVTLISRHDDEHATRALATGLPSLGGPFATFGLGGLALQDDDLYAVVGLNPQAFGDPAQDCQGGPPGCTDTVSRVQELSGTLNEIQSLHGDHGWEEVAGVGRFDFDYAAANPDPGNPEYQPGDANPFGVAAGPDDGFYVVDAASNTLDFVTDSGEVSVLAFIPDPPNHEPIYDAAPTCAAVTPDGDVYVATESSSLWRWDGTALTEVLSGGRIGQVVGCVADEDGNLYLANLSSRILGSVGEAAPTAFDGSIVKVAPDLETSYVATGLNYPSGIALGEDEDELYVALNGLCPSDLSLLNADNSPPGGCPASGEVVRIELPA